jgi:hypothetical protein
MQLDMILASLQDNHQVAALFACLRLFAVSDDKAVVCDLNMTEALMKTLLRNLGYWTVSYRFNGFKTKWRIDCGLELCMHVEINRSYNVQEEAFERLEKQCAEGSFSHSMSQSVILQHHIRQLLHSLHRHLLAFCCTNALDKADDAAVSSTTHE